MNPLEETTSEIAMRAIFHAVCHFTGDWDATPETIMHAYVGDVPLEPIDERELGESGW